MDSRDNDEIPASILDLSRIVAELLIQNGILAEENEFLHTKQNDLTEEKETLLEEKAILTWQTISLNKKVNLLTDELRSLKEQLALLKAKRFGKSSEKLDRQISELELRIEDKEIVQANSEVDKTDELAVERRRTGRVKLPEHLERIDNIIAAPSYVMHAVVGSSARLAMIYLRCLNMYLAHLK